MPAIRFEWQPSNERRTTGQTLGRAAADAALLASGPVGIVISALGQFGPNRRGELAPHLPVNFDLESERVTVETSTAGFPRPSGMQFLIGEGIKLRQLARRPEHEALLQQAYDTGVVPEGLDINYQAIARSLVELRRQRPADAPPPTIDDLPTFVPDDDSGQDDEGTQGPLPGASNFDVYNPYFAPQLRGGGVPVVVPIVPPGGFAGFAQQTPAAQRALSKGGGTRRRRRKKASKAASPRRRKRKGKSRKAGGKFVKGSAAAKRHMAKLRRMRKK